ncbi:MAG: hypothetical protein AAGC47_08505 [Bacteroidota bacterium]
MEHDEEVFGPAMVFNPGQRRVYPPAWMFTMRAFANVKKANELLPSLGNQISKDSGNMKRSNSRDSHSSHNGTASMNVDPRARAFPSPMPFAIPPINRGALAGGGTGGGADPFDLSSARNKPPPMLRSQASGRDGDPRGSRSQRSGRGG